MDGGHYRLNGHEPGQTLRDGEGQGSLALKQQSFLSQNTEAGKS